jgi:hypothetical protein
MCALGSSDLWSQDGIAYVPLIMCHWEPARLKNVMTVGKFLPCEFWIKDCSLVINDDMTQFFLPEMITLINLKLLNVAHFF